MTTSITQGLLNEVREWRHHIHMHPETAFTEEQTAEFIATTLRSFPGMEVTTGIGGTGVVGTLKKGDAKAIVGLRADMDSLPITERTDLPYSSTHEGKMHACGHDGHMSMVLGAASALANDENFNGTVRFIFQPAEEPGKGAQAMISDGLFEKYPVDSLYGVHNMPGLPAGELHLREGGIMGSEDNFEIRISGVGGHASMPHRLADPLVTAAEIIVALQGIVSRSIPANDSAVLSCTEIITDGARNAVPNEVIIRGDTRNYTDEAREILERRIRQITEGICSANGVTGEVKYTYEFEPTVNDPECVEIATQAAQSVLGTEQVQTNAVPSMASEDFGYFAREVPSCFVFLGNGTEDGDGGTPLHSALYDFNDEILEAGVAYFVSVALHALENSSKSA